MASSVTRSSPCRMANVLGAEKARAATPLIVKASAGWRTPQLSQKLIFY
jgi:hypothetical protein